MGWLCCTEKVEGADAPECHRVSCWGRSRGRGWQHGSPAPLPTADPRAGSCAGAVGGSGLGGPQCPRLMEPRAAGGLHLPRELLAGRRGRRKGGQQSLRRRNLRRWERCVLGGSGSPGQWLWGLRWLPLHPFQCPTSPWGYLDQTRRLTHSPRCSPSQPQAHSLWLSPTLWAFHAAGDLTGLQRVKDGSCLTGLAGRLRALDRWECEAQGAKPDSPRVPSGGKVHPWACLPSTAALAHVFPSKNLAKTPEVPQAVPQGWWQGGNCWFALLFPERAALRWRGLSGSLLPWHADTAHEKSPPLTPPKHSHPM